MRYCCRPAFALERIALYPPPIRPKPTPPTEGAADTDDDIDERRDLRWRQRVGRWVPGPR